MTVRDLGSAHKAQHVRWVLLGLLAGGALFSEACPVAAAQELQTSQSYLLTDCCFCAAVPTRTPTPTQLTTPTATPTLGPCIGDCGHDNKVTVDELVKGVNIALGNANLSTCPEFDCNQNGSVTVDCLVKGVSAALNGCVGTLPGTKIMRPDLAEASVRFSHSEASGRNPGIGGIP